MTSVEKALLLEQITSVADVQNKLDEARIGLYRLKKEGLADNIRDLQSHIELELAQLREKLHAPNPVQPA